MYILVSTMGKFELFSQTFSEICIEYAVRIISSTDINNKIIDNLKYLLLAIYAKYHVMQSVLFNNFYASS